jgi:hypothetical protein
MTRRSIGRHSQKKKAKKAPAASDVLVPPVPNSVPLAAAHPQEEVQLAFPPNPVPPVLLEQPPNPPNQQQQQNKLQTSKIQSLLAIPSGSRNSILKVLQDVDFCMVAGVPYDSSVDRTSGGATSVIKDDSVELQILAGALEAGKSMDKATVLVNEHRREDGSKPVGRSAVYSRSLSLDPVVSETGQQSQGNRDGESNYGKARYNYVQHLLVRFGHTAAHDEDLPNPLPDWLDRDKLADGGFMLSINQITFWDETHQKCKIGGTGTDRDRTLWVKRDENGKLDKNGKLADTKKRSKVKYEKEGRFGLGVTATKSSEDSDPVGVRMLAYDYSGKTLISLKERDARRREEITRVHNLKGGLPWVMSNREEGQLFLDDLVGEVNGIGDSIAKKLQDVGITNIADLKNMTEQKLNETAAAKLGRGMSLQTLKQYQAVASTSEITTPPNLVTNYRKEANPYLARFGHQLWEKEIDQSITLRSSLCITSYITHMWDQTALAMHGTIHQDDWLVYHDALSLMTAKQTMEWMENTTTPNIKKYIDRWILPVLGCNDDILRFGGRPMGDFPESMPLDNTLNNDLKASNNTHLIDRVSLDEDDPRKFSLSTPKRCSEAIRRIWDFGLTGKAGEDQHEGGLQGGSRIVQDVYRVIDSYKTIEKGKPWNDCCWTWQQCCGRQAEGRRATGLKAARGGKPTTMTQEEQDTKLKKRRHPSLIGCTRGDNYI